MNDTEILRLFREHRSIRQAAERHVYSGRDYGAGYKNEDEEMELLFWKRTDAIEAEMNALPSTCAADFAAKMITSHCHGEFSCLDWDNNPVWIEARKLVGIDQPDMKSASISV